VAIAAVGIRSATASTFGRRHVPRRTNATAAGMRRTVECTTAASTSATAREKHISELRLCAIVAILAGIVIATTLAALALTASLADHYRDRDSKANGYLFRDDGCTSTTTTTRTIIGIPVACTAGARTSTTASNAAYEHGRHTARRKPLTIVINAFAEDLESTRKTRTLLRGRRSSTERAVILPQSYLRQTCRYIEKNEKYTSHHELLRIEWTDANVRFTHLMIVHRLLSSG
jgi:hypothetical protein